MPPSPFRQNAIVDAVRREIIDGTFAPGQRLPTRSELVTRFDASSVTVQRALDTVIADGFVQAHGRSGTFVVNHPPHLCHYGLVIPGALEQRETWPHYWRALLDEAAVLFGVEDPRSLSVYCGIEVRDDPHYTRLLHDVQSRRLAGLIFATNPYYLANSPVLTLPGLPRVSVGCQAGSAVPSVLDLDTQGILDRAIERFAHLGRTRVALLTVPGIEPAQRDYFLARLQHAGLSTRPEWLQAAVIQYPYWAEHITRLLFRSGQDQLPDALLITDDNLVGPATAGMKALGLRCPADVEVIAHANFPWPTASALPITRVGFDINQLLHQGIADLGRQRQAPERPTYSRLPPVVAAQHASSDDHASSAGRRRTER
jgi:DNA-binding LacI/PurR family transcriptional regulator/DNA-binding transcriptional regulator YhcF (GntR family)